MKKLWMLLPIFLFTLPLLAQTKFGVRAGISNPQIHGEALQINDNLILTPEDARVGYHAGLFLQAKKGIFFIQPEALYSFSQNRYVLGAPDENGVEVNKRYQSIDVPVMMGLKFGPLRLQAGPTAHLPINEVLEIKGNTTEDIGYQSVFDRTVFGYQMGLGVDFGKVIFDFKWQNGLDQFNDSFLINNETFNFDQNRKAFTATVGIAF